jgi:siderophore synthetase component
MGAEAGDEGARHQAGGQRAASGRAAPDQAAPDQAAPDPTGRQRAAPDQADTLAALTTLRPGLVDRYLDASGPARAAVLARLWGAFAREPIAGLRRRQTSNGRLTITLDDGRELSGPADAAEPFANPGRLTLRFDNTEYDHPARLLEALPLAGARDRLVRELDNSVANLALARAASQNEARQRNARQRDARQRDAPQSEARQNEARQNEARQIEAPQREARQKEALIGLVEIEQAIADGHPLHPCCRTRIGMSTEDVLRYAPEHHPVVHLHIVEVDPGHWHTTGVPKPPLLPVHPWQLDRVLASGVARDTGTTMPARHLMSLRTLAPTARPDLHLKTAVDVQMTSAIRTLSPATVHNGPLASRLLAELARKTTGLTILTEPSGASIVLDGEEQRSMACVWREAPPPQRHIVPLAALESMTDELIELMLPPLLTRLHLGVALEAHGQNTLVAFEDGRPVELFYRDVGGIHVSPRRLARAGVEMPPLRGTVPTDDPDALRTKLFAAVFNGIPIEPHQWDTIARVARESAGNEDRTALFADTLPLKATTAMRLADDPLEDRWAQIPNPLQN